MIQTSKLRESFRGISMEDLSTSNQTKGSDQRGVVHLVIGSWTCVTRNGLDFTHEGGWPLISMTFMFNNETGEFISRVFNRIVEVGQIEKRKDLLANCQKFFEGNFPCMGRTSVKSENFPFGLKFSPNCSKVVKLDENPSFLEGLVCTQCDDSRLPIPFEIGSTVKTEPFNGGQATSKIVDEFQIGSALDILTEAEDLFEVEIVVGEENKNDEDTYGNDFGTGSSYRRSARSRKRPAKLAFDEDQSDRSDEFESDAPEYSESNPLKPATNSKYVVFTSDGTKQEVPDHSFDPKNYYVDWNGQTLIMEINYDREKTWCCPICSIHFQGRARLTHLQTHLLYRTKCEICGLAHICSKNLWDHFRILHEDADEWRVKCGICHEMLDIKSSRDFLGDHWAECNNKKLQDGGRSSLKEVQYPHELLHPPSFLVEYETKVFTLKGQIPKKEVWTCPMCSTQVKGYDRTRHLKWHGKFRVRCEICFLNHLCPLKLWDHYTNSHSDKEVWKGRCAKCTNMVDLRQSRDALQTHYLGCENLVQHPLKIMVSSTSKRAGNQVKTIRGNTPKHLFQPSHFVVEWEGKELTIEGYVGTSEPWTCPICSLTMPGKQRMSHLKVHFFFRVGCEICRMFHLCPRKLWDHHQDQHKEQDKWLVLCAICTEKIDIKPSRDTLREHLLECLNSPIGKRTAPAEITIQTNATPADKLILSAPQGPAMKKSFDMEWLGKTIVVSEQGSDSSWTCPMCEIVVKNRISHLQNKHYLHQIPCGICGLYHMCPYKLWDHIQERHAASEKWPVKCPICKEILDIKESRDACRDHLIACVLERKNGKRKRKIVKPRPIRVCETCGKTFRKRYTLHKHIMKDHQNVKPKCPVCLVEMSFCQLESHMRIAHQATRFVCPMCFKREKFANVFWEHIRDNHLERIKQIPCPVCKEDFPINLEDGPKFVAHHEECHRQHLNKLKEGEKERMKARPRKFPCSICPKRFQVQYLLNAHMKTHKEIRQFCHLCKYRTHSSAYLRAHLNDVHGDPSNGVKCEYCDEKFMTHASLEGHLDSSHGIKAEHECDKCPLKLPSKLQLKKHKRTCHSDSEIQSDCDFDAPSEQHPNHGDKPGQYKCSVCDDDFSEKNQLLVHLNTLHGYSIPVERQTSASHNELPRNQYIDLVQDQRNDGPITSGTSLVNPNISYSIQGVSEGLSNQTIVVTMEDPHTFQISM